MMSINFEATDVFSAPMACGIAANAVPTHLAQKSEPPVLQKRGERDKILLPSRLLARSSVSSTGPEGVISQIPL